MTISHRLRLLGPISRLLQPARPPTAPRPSGPAGIYLGWGSDGPVLAGPEHHVLILGPPRSGKTSRLIVPAVFRHRGPAVVTSTKPDVITSTLPYRRNLGACWYWDPSAATTIPMGLQPLRWSPISGCDDWDQAVTRAHALAGAARPNQSAHDAHWIERAQALLAPLLHAAALNRLDLIALLSWLHTRQLERPLAILRQHGSRRASELLTGLARTEWRELSGVFSTADGLLAAYRTDAALTAAAQPNFDPHAFAASTDTLYLVSPASTQQLHAALVVALLDQIRTATYQRRPRPPMLYALDEVANIAPLPDLPATLAEGGSQGLTVLASLQDLSQARTRWGHAADGFLTLFTHKLILGGIADPATLKAVNTLAGDIDVPVPTTSTTRQGLIRQQHSTSWTTRRQPVLPPERIANLAPGTALLVRGTQLTRVHL